MPDKSASDQNFLKRITSIIEENIANEQFGVSELARESGMSRSNLLRKIKKQTGQSVSQFIREVRLEKAMEVLRNSSFTVSEAAYQVGFNSPSYFIKCFHDYYGYPPGEVGKHDPGEKSREPVSTAANKKIVIAGLGGLIILSALLLFIFLRPGSSKSGNDEISIAVLPFKNDSNDSTNIYLINGLMESLLDNLQKIEGLRVISRTSVEKFRTGSRTIPEIANELNVTFFVEGSGQKIGDQILLHIQLIEGASDKHLWSAQYNRETTDIFDLQREIANQITDNIKVIITPEEESRINKAPTDDLVAYDYFLRGLDLFYQATREGLEKAIVYFNKAIEQDPGFARAHADLAISYALLDYYQTDKIYTDLIRSHAERALKIDAKLPQSLVAQAMYYRNINEPEMALPYLEKALQYSPNSAMVINLLSDFYTNTIPDTEKYLEYALKGIGLDIAAHDSVDASYIYMHLSNALLQSGFLDEAEKYINRSLAYNRENLYSAYIKAYIHFGRDRDLNATREELIRVLNKDMTRMDIIMEVAKISYYMRDYESAYTYFKKIIDIREAQNLDIYKFENAKIGLVYARLGMNDEADAFFRAYKNDSENDESGYRDLSLAVYYSYFGDTSGAIEHLEMFVQQSDIRYLILPFLEIDPLLDPIKDLPEFSEILNQMHEKYQRYHEKVKRSLEKKGLI